MKNKLSMTVLLCICSVLILTSCSSGQARGIEIIAHRGFAGQYPENTIYSAKQAVKLGVPVEFDVQFTEDGVMVVIHDDTVDRTTNGSGNVSRLKYSYIETLDAGKKISSQYAGEKVPKFTDYLTAVKSLKYIYPELKTYRNTDDIVMFTKTLVENGLEDKCAIQAFKYSEALPYIRQVSKKIKVAALCSNQKMFDYFIDIAKTDNSSMMSISASIATPENLEACKKNNLDVSVWTANDEDTLKKLIDMGYRRIICDRYFELSGKSGK